MNGPEMLAEGLYRLCVPFEDLYTSVFFFRTDAGCAILDAATNAEDVRKYILPAMEKLGIAQADVCFLLASHTHSDHFGGMHALAEACPLAVIGVADPSVGPASCHRLIDGERLLGCIRVLHLPGHTGDAMAFLDERHGIVLTVDALQLEGIGRYGCGVEYPAAYRRSIARLREEELSAIVTSHDYRPLGWYAEGHAIRMYLAACESYMDRLTEFAAEYGSADAAAIADAYNACHVPDGCPPVPASTFAGILRERE